MKWKVLNWEALLPSLYPTMSHANPSHSLASLFNSRSVPTLWTFLMIPRPLAEPDYPSQTSFFTSVLLFETVPLSRRTLPLSLLPSTHFSQNIFRTEPKFLPTFFKEEETKGKRPYPLKKKCLPQSHTKSSTNIYQTCSTSGVLLNWSRVHLGRFGVRAGLHTCCTKACCNMERVQTLLLLELKGIFYQSWAGWAAGPQQGSCSPVGQRAVV